MWATLLLVLGSAAALQPVLIRPRHGLNKPPGSGLQAPRLKAFSDEDLLADAGFGAAEDFEAFERPAPRVDHGYEREHGDNTPVDVAAIDAALAERAERRWNGASSTRVEERTLCNEAKRARDFQTADAIRDGLLKDYNVVVWDRDRLWAVRGNRRRPGYNQKRAAPEKHDLVRDPNDSSEVDVAAVDALLLERLKCKLARDFDRADELRGELERTHGVSVFDDRKMWRAGRRPDYRFEGRGALDEAAVVALIRTRQDARKRKNFREADALLQELLELGVVVDDKRRTFRAVDVYAAPADAPPDADVVDRLVRKRSAAKLLRRFDEADDIRATLLTEHDVHVDDKKRAWSWQPPADDDDEL